MSMLLAIKSIEFSEVGEIARLEIQEGVLINPTELAQFIREYYGARYAKVNTQIIHDEPLHMFYETMFPKNEAITDADALHRFPHVKS